jgi:cysteine desulfurase
MSPVYLDNNASTQMDPTVIDVMTAGMRQFHANPSSSEHVAGAEAMQAVEVAREAIAAGIGARPPEITFCAGSTEANNLALLGAFPALKKLGRPKIITSAIEHPSVLAPLNWLQSNCGASVVHIPVGESGRVTAEAIGDEITATTGLVSVMAANNETGIVQPIEEIAALCAERGVLFHTDYSQATAYRSLNVQTSNIHMASFSGHKMFGPKGIGVLYRRLRKPQVELTPVIHGGGQERGLRSGTLNTPAIVALAKAFDLAARQRSKDCVAIAKRRARLVAGLSAIDGVRTNGDQEHVLPNTVSFSAEGVEPLALMRQLRNDVVFSASSACSTDRVEPSHVLVSMFGESPRTRAAFRLGLGRFTTDQEIELAIAAFTQGIGKLRSGRLG